MADWFKQFEDRPITEKSQIKWNFTKDFEVQSRYIVDDVTSLISGLDKAKDDDLLRISQHCYNLLSWIKQMAIMGFTGLPRYIDELLVDNFKDRDIIQNLYRESLRRWVEGKEGRHKIGENYFSIDKGSIYYRGITGKWYEVEEGSVFNLMPKMHIVEDSFDTKTFNAETKPSVYEQIYSEWMSDTYVGGIPEKHFTFKRGESTPEDELNISIAKIRKIIERPVALMSLRDKELLDDERLEYLIKLSYLMTQFVQTRRRMNEHSVYLLRDCIIFYELHKTLDIIEGSSTSSDQLIAGRKLLSNSRRPGGHWYFSQEALFIACEKHPNNFDEFYNEYSNILNEYEEYSEEFREFIEKLARYVDEHIPADITPASPINIIDLGFQGSINILIKYVIDNHCKVAQSNKTVVHMYVLAEWFKGIYPGMYSSETYSLLTDIEVLARNELMYDYKAGSFMEGAISVVMGSKEDQENADIELLVTTMTALIAKKLLIV